MSLKEIYRDDLLNRFASHTFTETTVGDMTLVEFKDGSSDVVGSAKTLVVDDAYENIRRDLVGGDAILPVLTGAQKNALTSPADGTPLIDSDLNQQQVRSGGEWVGGADAVETIDLLGTSHTLVDGQSGKHLTFSDGSAITVTLDTGLKAGFQCSLEQIGAGVVQVSANGTTINSLNGNTKTAGQFAVVSLVQTTTDVYTFSGDTAS